MGVVAGLGVWADGNGGVRGGVDHMGVILPSSNRSTNFIFEGFSYPTPIDTKI